VVRVDPTIVTAIPAITIQIVVCGLALVMGLCPVGMAVPDETIATSQLAGGNKEELALSLHL
jgi:hypothetical protein